MSIERTGLLRPTRTILPLITAALLASACAGGSNSPLQLAGLGEPAPAAAPASPEEARNELQKATEYWGQRFAKTPHDLTSALSYARNLKAGGHKKTALAVFQQASVYHGNSRELAGEYGRLALEFDQVSLANKLLALADDPTKPDWRILSARGTALAKEGKYKEALPFLERARSIAPDQASIVSNLAMAHTAMGDLTTAESLLREVALKPNSDPKIRQNLALVLGLQGRYTEAKAIAAEDMPASEAYANIDAVQKLVRIPAADAAALRPGSAPDTARAEANKLASR